MLDATCAPADIAYPTDLILLNEAREKFYVEFGAKVAISLVDGYALVEKKSWNNYKEALTLQEAVAKI